MLITGRMRCPVRSRTQPMGELAHVYMAIWLWLGIQSSEGRTKYISLRRCCSTILLSSEPSRSLDQRVQQSLVGEPASMVFNVGISSKSLRKSASVVVEVYT
jgi:hypothetical protein